MHRGKKNTPANGAKDFDQTDKLTTNDVKPQLDVNKECITV